MLNNTSSNEATKTELQTTTAGTLVVIWFFIETAYTRASTLLSWVALWAFGFVRASVRARTGVAGLGVV
jgi:hypothetical protein